jgi:hypothetical protein
MYKIIATAAFCWFLSFSLSAQVITQAEYFFNTDPGVGNGTSITVAPGDTVLTNYTFSTASLDVGYHYLWVRTRDDQDQWSIYHDQLFYIYNTEFTDETELQPSIVAAEYFLNTDPGVGNGTPITVTPGDTVLTNFTMPASGLDVGYHYLWVRTQDANGQWSIYHDQLFYVYDTEFTDETVEQTPIVSAEYFIDTDPGVGNATPLSVTAGDTVLHNFNLDVSAFLVGTYNLYVRTVDANGQWSLHARQEFDVVDCAVEANTGTDVQTACESYMWIDGNTYTQTNNAAATFTLTNVAGCDSVVTLDLTIDPLPDNGITATGATLTADAASATYQWIDCADSQPIQGETAQVFTTTTDGSFSVEVTLNGCTSVSACETVLTTSIADHGLRQVSVYPNPNNGVFTIANSAVGTYSIALHNATGQLLFTKQVNAPTTVIDIQNYAAGIYMLSITEGDKITRSKLIKN